MDIPRDTTDLKRRRIVYGGLAGGLGLLAVVAVAQLEPAAPSVARATLWDDTVRQGSMVRQVRGPGTLIPERIRYISAITSGRVEQLLVEPGTEVTPETVLLVLSNPEVHMQAAESQRQLAASRAALTNLRANLENQRLTQEAAVATARSQLREAERQAEADRNLGERGLIARLDMLRSIEAAGELAARVAIEEKRLEFMAASTDAQMAAQRSELDRLQALVALRQTEVASLALTAGVSGVLRELPLQEGEWVGPGNRLAVVVQPGKLKAELRIPETQAKDLVLGQRATIDTRNGLVPGRVSRIDPAVQNGTVTIDVALEGELPRGARPDLSVDGTIEIERLEDVLYIGRPAYGQAESTVGLFRFEDGGRHAQRVSVRLGRSSVNLVEVTSGLRVGDVVILSDMSQWDAVDRVRLR